MLAAGTVASWTTVVADTRNPTYVSNIRHANMDMDMDHFTCGAMPTGG